MTILAKVGICTAIAAAAFAIVPALKGPFNRLRNEANERLNDEFVVDNYKAEYVKLNEKKIEVKNNIEKFVVEKKVVEKKLQASSARVEASKNALRNIGTSNLAAFNRAKDVYESFKLEHDNLVAMSNVYSNAIAKLEMGLTLIEDNMRKAKTNVDVLSSKKMLVESIKGVNGTIANLKGIGEDAGLGIAIEKLDETALRENIKLEALADTASSRSSMTEAEVKAYLESIK